VHLESTVRRSPAAWCNTIIRVLHIVVHANKITTIFFLGNKNHGTLFLYILVIVCASVTNDAVIFKRIADMSLVKDFCNDYRTYLCWQVSCILFSIIQVLMSISLNFSFLGAKKKSTSPATMRSAFWHNWTAYLSRKKKIDLHSLFVHPSLKYWSVYLLSRTCRLPCTSSAKKFSLWSSFDYTTRESERKPSNTLAKKKATHDLTFWLCLPGCLVSILWPRRPCCCERYMTTVINTSNSFHLGVSKSR